ncbi:MAG: hypothetical protein K2H44_05880, partial [Muribaculaceae bacterium]|nr:hypothetical protein [Muribaculaceae bacterium]
YILIFIAILSSCSKTSNINWNKIDKTICTSPQDGLSELERIIIEDLSNSDLQRYNLLYIKALDKLYITHTTDSIILDVIDYFSRKDKSLYAEALYYGGRVYSDLGDKPSAIKYYQSALDLLPDNSQNIVLRSNLLSQLAQEYLSLSLHKEALDYLEKVLVCDSIKKDSINLAFDYGMIGEIHQRLNKPNIAGLYYRKGLVYLSDKHSTDRMELLISLANVYLQKNNVDSAEILITNVIKETTNPDKTNSKQCNLRNSALSTGIQIYYKKGSYNSTYIYARELAMSNSHLNRHTGFKYLFKPEVMKYIPSDSLVFFIKGYHKTLEERYNEHDAQQVVMQNARYNYETHERERLKAELREQKTLIWLAIVVIVALVMLLTTLFYRNREKARLIELHKAIEDVESINRMILGDNKGIETNPSAQNKNLDEAQEYLLTSLIEKVKENQSSSVYNEIVNSDVVIKIKDNIYNEKTSIHIPWSEIEGLIKNINPKFIPRLRFLSNGQIKLNNIRLALLIKCGLTPGEIATVLNLKKNTLTYHRKKLCSLLAKNKIDISEIDDLIKLL